MMTSKLFFNVIAAFLESKQNQPRAVSSSKIKIKIKNGVKSACCDVMEGTWTPDIGGSGSAPLFKQAYCAVSGCVLSLFLSISRPFDCSLVETVGPFDKLLNSPAPPPAAPVKHRVSSLQIGLQLGLQTLLLLLQVSHSLCYSLSLTNKCRRPCGFLSVVWWD